MRLVSTKNPDSPKLLPFSAAVVGAAVVAAALPPQISRPQTKSGPSAHPASAVRTADPMSLQHIRELAIYRKSFANCGRMTIDSTWDDAENGPDSTLRAARAWPVAAVESGATDDTASYSIGDLGP